jgi:hypothetical protein
VSAVRTVSALVLSVALSTWSAEGAAQEKYAVGLFHFNIQYVAGGTVGLFSTPNPAIDLDNDTVEDLIVTESFAPIIDLFEKHPSWGVDIELQGYFLDVLAERHPDLLAKLKTLASSKQIDVVSFHYSDQMFIGFPADEWERSQALTAATFAKYGIPLSRTVFCQEGQAGEAMAARMAGLGYRNMVWPKNLWSYQHASPTAAPLYSFGDVFMIQGGRGLQYQNGNVDITLDWTFMDDGETKATGGLNPYTPDAFKVHPDAVKEYEDALSGLEAQGYQLVTVDKYVDAVKDEVTPEAPPPLFDGTWQPNSTDGVFKWFGGPSLILFKGQRDNEVRSLQALAHRELVAAETAAKVAAIPRDDLDSAWRDLALAEVSDSTGINPFRGEVEYGIAYATEALRIARDVIERAKDAAGQKQVTIDPEAGTMTADTGGPPALTDEEAPLALEITSGDRDVTQHWQLVAPGHHRVELAIGVGTGTVVDVTFPGQLADELVTTRALADDALVTRLRSAYTFDHFWLPLPLGLISLGPNLFLIKDMARVHLAAKITRDSGDVEFRNETVPEGETETWVFHVFEGSADDALALARSLNDYPVVAR